MKGIANILFYFFCLSSYAQTNDSLITDNQISANKPDTGLVKKKYELETGIASFYAKRFEGRKCSNGSVFRHDSLTAAHKSLPFGTIVKLTNLKNDSIVIVKITDRLPKKSKRTIDLTMRAAKQLNFVRNGLTKVSLEILE